MRTNLYKPQNCGSGPQPHTGAAPRRHRLKRLCALAIAFLCGMQWAWAYDFAVTSGGNTYYFNITDATNKYVEVTYPNSNNVSWTGYTKPTGTLNIPGIFTYNGTSYTVTGIGNAAFAGCTDITYVGIPTTITSMDSHAFRNCTGITTVAIYSNAVMSNNYTSSYNLTKIFGSQVTKYAIGNTVTAIGPCAFYGASNFATNVDIPASVTSIGYGAFEDSGILGVAINGTGVTIGNGAFSQCSSMTSFSINGTVNSIASLAFKNCNALTMVNITDLAAWCSIDFEQNANPLFYARSLYLNGSKILHLVIPDGVTTIKSHAFYNGDFATVKIPSSVTSIGEDAFFGCTNLNRAITTNLSAWCNITFANADANPLKYGKRLDSGGNFVTALNIPSGVTAIKPYAFYGCTSITSVTIPAAVASIGSEAFNGCTSMTQVTMNRQTGTTYGSSAFGGCTGLTKLIMPNPTTALCSSTFPNAGANPLTYANHLYNDLGSEITVVTIPTNTNSIGAYAFSGGKYITSVSMPTVATIGAYAFSNCSALPQVSMPNVTSIGADAFHGCTGIASVTMPNVTSIGANAFSECSALPQVTIPKNVTTIGSGAFGGCTNLTSVTINSNAVASADFTYQNYSDNNFEAMFGNQVTSYTFGSAVTGIGAYAMYGCSGMTSVSLPNSLTSIGSSAFYGCTGLTSVTMPNVTSIGSSAFCGCTGLASVTIPSSVTTLGYQAFRGCTNLTSVTINSNAVASADFTYQNYNSNNFKAMFGNQVTSYTIGAYVTAIGNFAFYGCTGIAELHVLATTPPTIASNNTFYSVDKTIPVYVPAGTMAAYKAAPYWSEFFGTLPLPSDLQYTFVSPTQMQFSWTRNPGQTHIIIDFADNDAFVGANRINSSDTEFTVNFSTPLLPNTTYYIRAKAIYDGQNSGLVSEFTEAVSFITPLESYAPTGLTAQFVSATQVDVSWTNVAGFTGSGFQFSAQEDFSATLTPAITSTGPSSMSLTFSTPLEPSTTYYVRVMNQFNAVQGPWSEAFELTTPAACAAPTALAATNVGPFSATLSWTGDADEYNVEYRTVAATTEVNEGFANGIPSSWTNTGTGGGWSLNSGAIVSTIEAGVGHYNSISIPVTNKKGKLTFRAKKGSSNAAISVYVSNDNTNFTQVGVISTRQLTASYKRFTVDLSDQAEEAGYIRLYHSQRLQSTNSTTVYVDDIVFESYQMGAWIPAGATTESTMALTGLTCGGTYQFRVKAPCTTGFMSDWATSANFSTLYNIAFQDAAVKALCVANWDANSDGELSYAEAAAVTSLGSVFTGNTTIQSFNELQYFTGLSGIGADAFKGCSNLAAITLSAQITSIGNYAFGYAVVNGDEFQCSSLTSIVIPEGVTQIGDYAFSRSGLQSITLPSTLTSLGGSAFSQCQGLTSVVVPASVSYINGNPFWGIDNLASITVDANNATFDSRNNCNAIIKTATNELISGCTSTVIPATVTAIGASAFDNIASLTTITLPASVTTIGDHAFLNCGLTSATLGQGVTTIGDYAFSGCMSLASLTVEATTPPTLGTNAFGQSTNLADIALNVPCEGLQAYKSHATWGQFNNVTECEYRFVTTGSWNVATNWLYGELPGEDDDVVIEKLCNLATEVNVASVTIVEGGTIQVLNNGVLTTPTINNTVADRLRIYGTGQVKHNNLGVMATVRKSITGYGAANVNKSTGWRFITPPASAGVGNASYLTDPASVTNLITTPAENYDLYSFAGWEELEWRNYKANSFNMSSGSGYLYARQDNANLIFTGKLEPSQWYTFEYLSSEGGFTEWQLLGNPFACNAYITNASWSGMAFYRMNTAGDGYIAAEGAIAPCEGFFVHVPGPSEGQSFSLTREAPTMQPATLNINLSSNAAATRGGQADVIDRAIVHFGEGSTLEKLTFRDDNTRLYIPQDGTDYAVVKAGTVGELPVSFKAEKNGAYTLGFTNAEVTFSYLRLIDNMTGTETDLLQQPYYTFDARTTDYASRFRLQFATGTSENAEGSTFGFVNASGNFTVFGIDGEATLQVIDVTGRVLSSETFSGSYEKRLNVAPGVYLLRLIHGDDVKVQKVVVR